MTSSSEFQNHIPTGAVVAAVDGSTHADQALAWAAEEARLRRCPLAIVHVEKLLGSPERGWLAEAGIPLSQITDEMRADSEELLHRARTFAATSAPLVDTVLVRYVGDARDVLLGLADRASVIVLGSRGRGPVSSLLLGSVSVAVSRHAACPVVVVRPREGDAGTHGVLVGTDGSSHSVATIETAFREASYRGRPLTVVYCQWEALLAVDGWRVAPEDAPCYEQGHLRVAEVLAGLQEKFPDVAVTVEVAEGHADQCIADLSSAHELTVIGRRARTLLERVGSMSLTTAIVEHSSGPVLIVP
jgi:nucleotide-binding universal stress UspA family protein